MATPFDPNAAAVGDGIYGLPHTPEEARCVVLPVPFDATTSYRAGTRNGPEAVRDASLQVDLWDVELGRVYEPGIALLDEDSRVLAWGETGRESAEPIIEVGGDIGDDRGLHAALAHVNEVSARVNTAVYEAAKSWMDAGKIVATLGGDHSTPFGAIKAASERWPGLGVLHVDAHADLRDAYEGFTWSHASIMHNVATRLPQVARIVQVGIRDFCEQEVEFIRAQGGRIVTHFDARLAHERLAGTTWAQQVERIVNALPKDVYISFDIDGLDPTLCPSTGTPVPGGLSFHEATFLVGAVARSGRRIVAFDLNEVAPGEDDGEWDGNVGARLLYRMIGWAFASQGLLKPVGVAGADVAGATV